MVAKAPLIPPIAETAALRVAIVTETYPPEVNGVALTLATLARGLSGLGHAVTVIRPQRNDLEEVAEDRVKVFPVPGAPLPAYPDLRIGLPTLSRIRRVWRSERPDAVYIATEGPLGWAAARVARELGIAAISGYHTRFDEFARHYRLGFAGSWISRYLRRFHNSTRATLVPTEELRESLLDKGYRNVTVLRRAVDTTLFDPVRRDPALRREWGVNDDTPVVIWVGRIAPEKNLELTMRAFHAFRDECPGARLVWVGDGPARAGLERRYPDCIFAGMRHGEDLARHYASADAFFFASLTETYGNVTLEALASGLAVVAHDYGAAREHIMSGTDGFLAPVDEPSQFVGWARHLGRHADSRARVRSNARRAVTGLDPIQVAESFAELLRRHLEPAE
jgi:glycosyltransferase involved in cell wall biosynthesis